MLNDDVGVFGHVGVFDHVVDVVDLFVVYGVPFDHGDFYNGL